MDGFETGREPPNWEVFRDAGNALAPVQTKPITRAWERAPVRAHAPRLQGQRIWKKAGIQRENISTKSSEQDDLDLEGKGARKRMRIAGGKENIGEALFQKHDEAPNVTVEATDLANNREQEALKYVPRKRTNTDHVITPRKPLRPSSGNVRLSEVGTEKSLAEPAEEKPQRRRKSMRKSLIRLSPQPATPTSFMGLSQSREFASPIKNLRELSMRPDDDNEDKSAQPSVVDELPAKIAEASSVLSEAINEVDAEVEVVNTEPASIVGEVQSPLVEQSSIAADVAENVELEPLSRLTADQPEPEQPQWELQRPDEIHQGKPESTENEFMRQELLLDLLDATAPPKGVKIPLNDLEEPPVKSTVIASTEDYSAQPALQSEESSVSTILPTSEAHTFGSGEAEQDTGPSTPKPRKSIGTPKSKKGGSARQGTRRSTRKASANAVKSEDGSSENAQTKSMVEFAQQSTESITPSKNLARTGSSSRNEPREEVPSADQSPESATGHEAGSTEANAETVNVQQSALDTLQVAPATSQHYHGGEDPTVLAPEYLSQFDLGTPRRAPLSDTLNSESISAQTSASDSLAEESSSKEREETIEIVAPMTIENTTSMTELLDDQPEDAEADQAADLDAQSDAHSDDSSSGEFSPISKDELSSLDMDDQTVEMFDSVPGLALTDDTFKLNGMIESTDDLPGSSTPDPTTNELVETISENAMATYEEDDTDMLRNFLSRVKANKAAKAEQNLQKRKRSLPHSPLRLPLGEADTNTSPSPVKEKDEFDVSVPVKSPSIKRRKRSEQIEEEERTSSPKSIRRSGRTRLPVLKAPTVAPSFIPVRRLNQEENTTVTLRRSEEKELAALTKINTRKNKGGALSAAEVLMKKAEEKEDPVIRQRLLKEAFDEKTNRSKKSKKSKSKNVEWATEIAQFQEAHESKSDADTKRSENDRETPTTAAATAEDKKGATVRVVGARKKIALGMAVNGTPAPKRRTTRGRT